MMSEKAWLTATIRVISFLFRASGHDEIIFLNGGVSFGSK